MAKQLFFERFAYHNKGRRWLKKQELLDLMHAGFGGAMKYNMPIFERRLRDLFAFAVAKGWFGPYYKYERDLYKAQDQVSKLLHEKKEARLTNGGLKTARAQELLGRIHGGTDRLQSLADYRLRLRLGENRYKRMKAMEYIDKVKSGTSDASSLRHSLTVAPSHWQKTG